MDILSEGGGENIMYVDDEEGLAILGQEFLEDMGYAVTPVFSSREALRLFSADPQKYDMVVTDQTMPEMSGVEMAIAMKQISPETPVVLCSGSRMSLDSPGVSESSICEVLLKPEVFDRLPQLLSRLFMHKSDR
ncbi:response regulator [Geopsychrobacter electrodiphilus]|uniref:response regulator n=1 Tax=Geopsychrobacter electrodiphilus TaxID=225196 RepID=UPI000364551E|nr:response regulator [Geopsychrobacter electrodiphilus]